MDTKGTRELIKALNPKYEIGAIEEKEESIDTARLAQDKKKARAFQRGINYLKGKTRNVFNRFKGKKNTKKIRKGSVLNSIRGNSSK